MFNINLPINFNSPYCSLNIQEFWRRWHITLGRFVRDYIYIPLGGSRISEVRTYLNLMIVFFVIGLWHGAGWTFVFWGCLHGAALVIHRLWRKLNIKMPRFLAWLITFNFVNGAWIFFRAKTFGDAMKVLRGMIGMNGIVLPENLGKRLGGLQDYGVRFGQWPGDIGGNEKTILMVLIVLLLSLVYRNSNEMVVRFKPNFLHLIFICTAAKRMRNQTIPPTQSLYPSSTISSPYHGWNCLKTLYATCKRKKSRWFLCCCRSIPLSISFLMRTRSIGSSSPLRNV